MYQLFTLISHYLSGSINTYEPDFPKSALVFIRLEVRTYHSHSHVTITTNFSLPFLMNKKLKKKEKKSVWGKRTNDCGSVKSESERDSRMPETRIDHEAYHIVDTFGPPHQRRRRSGNGGNCVIARRVVKDSPYQ